MRRGEVRVVDLGPVRGSEANKRRPAVIVSNDGANSTAERLGRGALTVVPVTSMTDRVYPFQVLLPASSTGLRQDSKAQAEQVRAVAVERIGVRVGELPVDLVAALDEALRLHLCSDPALDVTQRLWPLCWSPRQLVFIQVGLPEDVPRLSNAHTRCFPITSVQRVARVRPAIPGDS